MVCYYRLLPNHSRLAGITRLSVYLGAGYDQVDVSACTARDIRVSNVPKVGDDATADVAMFLILGALRGFSYSTIY